MKNRRKRRQLELDVVDFSKRGNGIAAFEQLNGVKCNAEIPFTTPGDKVLATLIRKKAGAYSCKLDEIIVPSSDRIVPKCIHFSVCGGCRWQHIPYEKQLQVKERYIRKCFEPMLTSDVDLRPVLVAETPWQYRNKMEFSFSTDAAKNHYIGLVMDAGKGRVFNLQECHLVNTWFVDALKSVRQWWNESGLDAYHTTKDKGSLRTLTLREGHRTGDRLAMLTVSGNPDYALHKHQLESFVKFLRDAIEPQKGNLSIFLRIQQVAKGMATNFYEMHLYGADHIREILEIQTDPEQPPFLLEFNISPTAFFQPNTLQAEKLYSLAWQLAKVPKGAVVYDLYCGTGTFGICAAKSAKQVIGIELSPESALDARTNVTINKLNNVTIISGAVRYVLAQIRSEGQIPAPDIIIVDPPRAGLDPDALEELVIMNAKKILYVSCNPATQAANIAILMQHGYRIMSIQPVDQFPQTYHIENIVVLSKE
jgi:23S rRNA (uracil1939-C5)-methyltransferase